MTYTHDGTTIYTTRRRPDTDKMARLYKAERCIVEAIDRQKAMLNDMRDALDSVRDEIREEEKGARE